MRLPRWIKNVSPGLKEAVFPVSSFISNSPILKVRYKFLRWLEEILTHLLPRSQPHHRYTVEQAQSCPFVRGETENQSRGSGFPTSQAFRVHPLKKILAAVLNNGISCVPTEKDVVRTPFQMLNAMERWFWQVGERHYDNFLRTTIV